MTTASRHLRVVESSTAREKRHAHELRVRTLQQLDRVWPLARDVATELARTGMPTTWSPGVLPTTIVIDGVSTPALQLGSKGAGPRPTQHDFILEDGKLICWVPVENRSRLAGTSQPKTLHKVWYPGDEIHAGHRGSQDMSHRPQQLVHGLEYLLEGLRKLPSKVSTEA
jgi:hypothetical protein